MKKLRLQRQEGFTLVEFLLASAVFSFFIVMIMIGFLQINRTYNRGATVKDVQQTARLVIEDISRTISANSDDVAFLTPVTNPGLDGYRLCTGNTKYSWNAANAANNAYTAESYSDSSQQFILVKSSQGNSCEEQPASADSIVMIDGSMNTLEDGDIVVQSLTGVEPVGISDVFTITLVLSTDDEALTTLGAAAACEFNSGSEAREAAKQYCSVIELSTAVSTRK